jgi:hypothetical protein
LLPPDPPGQEVTGFEPMAATRQTATEEMRVVWLQLAVMTALILSYLWIWQARFEGDPIVVIALFAAIAFGSHRRSGESARDLGFRLDNFGSSLKTVLSIVVPLAVVMFAIGSWAGLLHVRPMDTLMPRLAVLPVSGLVQQYGLLGFYFHRFQFVLPGSWVPTLAAAGTFALFHLPNTPLTVATFLMGTLACLLYQKAPNLYALAIAHSILSFTIDTAFSGLLTDGMKVGHRALS